MGGEGAVRLLAAALAADGHDTVAMAGDDPMASTRDRCIAVIDRLRASGALAEEVQPIPSRVVFAADDDRWAGWRDDEPMAHPDPGPDRTAVLRALRRLTLPMRTVLVARDVAGLDVADYASVVGVPEAMAVQLLDEARAAFVVALDDELAGEPA